MRPCLTAVCVAFLLSGLGAIARSETLSVGDRAPGLHVSRWIKGEKVERFEPGKTYVIEFWATWCGPCRKSIPHLTELQTKYKDDVALIGVSTSEPDPEKVEPFVKRMGAAMAYRVALDSAAENADKDAGGRTAEAWMTPAGESGLPTAFIVKGGTIAWIGHPMELDKPLAQVVAGTFDVAAAVKERREAKAADEAMNALWAKAEPLVREHKYRDAVSILDDAIRARPALEPRLALLKVSVLAEAEDDDALTEYGSKMTESAWKENSDALNYLALMIAVTERKTTRSPKLVKLALRAAERANDLNRGEDARILDTFARVCFATGDPQRAAQLEEKAIGLVEEVAPAYQARLDKYRKAARETKR